MKVFYNLLGNSLISSITNYTVWFALTYFIYLQTRSVFATSLLAGIYLVIIAVSGFWFGSIVDHNKKKTAMLLSSFISLFIYIIGFVISISVPADTFTDIGNPMLWVFASLLLLGVTVGNIRTIALPTTVTLLIPEDKRDKANGLIGTTSGVSFLVVSVISGFLVGYGGMYYVFLLALFMTVVSIIHLLTISIPEKEIIKATNGTGKIDIKGTLKVIRTVPGLFALILFATFNNFLGGVFMSLMDAYGLSLVSVQAWGLLWGILSLGFIVGGLLIAKYGLGKNPLRALMLTNLVIWIISSIFTIQPSIILLGVGMFIYLSVIPYIEASEQTIIQKVVPPERQGRVFGFAQSIEMAASPLTAFLVGPLTQFVFIPYMTTGGGVSLIGDWFGTGPDRGIALVFTLTGLLGLLVTIIAFSSPFYRHLSSRYMEKN